MFCKKCGKPNDDDALFCEYCGAPINAHAPAQSPVPTPPPAPVPVYAAAVPEPKKRGKAGVIAAIVSSAAVLIAAAVVLLILKPWSSSKNNEPALNGAPTMTVNGKNVPVNKTYYFIPDNKPDDEKYLGVVFEGKTGGEEYRCTIAIKDTPKANTDYSTYDDVFVSISCESNDDFSIYNTRSEIYVSVGEYTPDGVIEITASGKAKELSDNSEIDFKVSGKVKKSN